MKTLAAIAAIIFITSFIGYFILLIKKAKLPAGNIFWADGGALLHFIVALGICQTGQNLCFWPWGQFFLGGQILSILIGVTVGVLAVYYKERFDQKYGTTGFSKNDLIVGLVACLVSIPMALTEFNINHGV